MSNNGFQLDVDSPDAKQGKTKFDLTAEEQEGASLLEEERNRQRLLAENEESEQSEVQHHSSNNTESNRLNEGQNYSTGVVPIKEEESN